ncbi:hypothetical protein INR49_002094, partial [Caranx melampygus]
WACLNPQKEERKENLRVLSKTRTEWIFRWTLSPKQGKFTSNHTNLANNRAVGRLEIQDAGGGATGGDHGTGVRRHHQHLGDRKLKVVRLSELISVLRLPPNAEACPMVSMSAFIIFTPVRLNEDYIVVRVLQDNMSAFCVETHNRTMVFAALKDDCVDWVEKLCHSAFQRGSTLGSQPLHMEENQIYASADRDFRVVVQRTDAAIRCGLQGSYWLQVGQQALLLKDTQKKSVVREWPYELLRRYGKDKMVFTIEAGRRCDSGPGTFTFETQEAENIFSLIQSTIKQKTLDAGGSQNQEVSEVASLLENSLNVEERKCPTPQELSAPSQTAPITLMPLPLIPTHSSPPGGHQSSQSDGVYADPADCIRSVSSPQSSTAQYVDPASFLPLKPPASREPTHRSPSPRLIFDCDHPDSVYSEVYDKLSPVQSKSAVTQRKGDEPIYAEPTTEKQQVTPGMDSKPDPFAHLYSQVCKPARSPGSSSQSSSTSSLP